MGAEVSCQLNCCTNRQKDGLEAAEGRNTVDWQHWVEDTDDLSARLSHRNQTDEHISVQQIGEERKAETSSALAIVATQPVEATDASTSASAAEEQGSQGLSQVKEECDCDADPEPSRVSEKQDLLPHWYSSPESIACKNSTFSMGSVEQATVPRTDRTLSGWYGEEAGVEAPPLLLSTNSNPNQDDFHCDGQALCHYHDLTSFVEEPPDIRSFQLEPGSQTTSGISVIAG